MAFSWTSTIGQGVITAETVLREIRTNIDKLDGNLACISHKGTVNSSEDSGQYWSNNSQEKDVYDRLEKSSYNDGQKSGANPFTCASNNGTVR